MTYKEVALAVLEDVRTEINEVIIRYGVRSELLDNGAVFYMNGNDGTDFDWQVNNHLCEFFTYYDNESKRGLIGKSITIFVNFLLIMIMNQKGGFAKLC